MSGFEDFLSSQAPAQSGGATAAPLTPDAPDALAPPDDFGKFLAKVKGEQDAGTVQAAQAATVANAHSGITADVAGQSAQLGRQLGVPQAAVETDPQQFQIQAKAQQNSAILSSNPVLAQWVAANPDSARIAQDEYEKLSTVEKLWQGTKDDAYALAQGLGGSFNSAALAVNRVIGAPLSLIPTAGEWWMRNMVQPREQAAGTFTPGPGIGQQAASTAGNLLGMLSQITLTGGGGEAVPAAAGAMSTIANAVQQAARSMAFPSLTASVNTGHDIFEKTGDPWAAARASIGSYLFSTLQGAVPFSAPGSLLTRSVSGAVAGVATSEGQRAAMNLLLPASVHQDFNLDETIFNALSGAVLGGVLGPRSDPHLYEAVRQTYADGLKAEEAQRDIGKVQALSQIAAESKLRESDPDAFHEFVRTVTDKSSLDAVYVNGAKLGEAFAQSAVEPTPDILRQMGEARATNGDVRIPIADYATKYAGTDIEKAILPDMKAAPDGMTFSEGQKFYQDAAKTLQTKADQMGQERQQRADLDADKGKVQQALFEQMVAAGREPGVAKTESTLASEFYATMAAREGMKPSEFMAAHPLNFAQAGGGFEQPAYHGSPHDFDKFSLDKIGTGEGVQAYGHGLYFAENKGIAQGYHKSLSMKVAHIDGVVPERGTLEWEAANSIASKGYDEALAQAKKSSEFKFVTPEGREQYKKLVAVIESLKDKKVEDKASGALYTVDIPDEHVKNFLHWDKPLSEQSDGVQKALAGDEAAYRPDGTVRNLKGEDLYEALIREHGSEAAASKYLDSIGIKGIKYLDEPSRPTGGPRAKNHVDTHNLVVFDDKIINLTHKDGKPVTAAERKEFLQSTTPGQARGAFDPNTRTISLTKDADLSTTVHELGHVFLDTLGNVAAGPKASEGVKSDFNTLLKWFGVKDADTWHAMSLDEQRPSHEKLAKAFEQYMFEGKAPNPQLQTVFGRIRSWMLNIYKHVANIGAELSPEVRGVFDRMLASDEAIKQAETLRSYAPLFADAKAMGKGQEAFDAYQELGRQATDAAVGEMQARSMRDMQWLSNAKSKAMKALQKQASAARKEVAGEVENEVSQYPAFQAQDYMRANKGSDPDIVANMYGFESGDAMRQAVMEAGNKKDIIQSLTDQRMMQRHGELTDPQSIEQAANEAVHNEARARFMATGLKALTDSPLPANQIAKAAKEVAESTIAGKTVGELRPDQYLAAEARANKDALAAAAKDPAKAIEAQRAALLNNRLARAAMDAQEDVQKGLEYLKKFDKPTVAVKVGADYMDRINELLSQYDVTNRFNTKSDVQARQSMRDWLKTESDRTGVMPEVSDSLLDFAQRKHWKELSVEDFRGLVDAAKSLEHVGREQQLVVVNGKKVELADMVERAKADLIDVPHSPPVDIQPHLLHASGLDKVKAEWLNLKSKVRGMDAALLKMEQVFQWLTYGKKAGLGETKSGPFLEMFQRAGDSEGAERQMRADSAKDMRELGAALKDAKVNLNESLNLPLTRPGRGGQWYREELIAAALNTGNAGNLRKLLTGYGWDEHTLMSTLDQHMSAAEWKFVQGTWDAIGKYGPQISELQRRLTGVSPKMVEAQTVSTQHGDFKGGYYPVVYDAFLDHNIETKNLKNADTLFENQWSRPTTSKGHTIERTDYQGPIQLSLGVIPRHIDQVTHDLAWRESIIDMNKFLSHPDIRSEVDQTMGREYAKQFRPWLQAMANDKVFNTAGDSAWESFYRKVRTNATLVGLGFRLSTMMIHGSSAMSNSIGEVGTKWFAKGAAQFATPERWEASKQFMFDRSPEMANRFNEHDRNIHEAIRAINDHQRSLGPVSATQKAVDGARRFAFYGVSALDMGSAAPTWMGAYLKGMEHEAKGGLGMSEEAAVDYANRAVRNAHGGGGVKDLSAVQRDKGVMSMATMFYSFWNHMYNRQRDLAKGYANLPDSFRQGTGTKDFAKLLARSWWYFVVPQLIHAAMKPTPASQQSDGEDDLGAMAAHMGEEVGLGFVSGVPVLRDLANAAINGRDYTITPLEQAGKSLVRAATDTAHLVKGEDVSPHAGKNFAQAAGYMFGLPSGQLSATGSFLWDVYNGDADPQGIKDWYTGIQNGRISP